VKDLRSGCGYLLVADPDMPRQFANLLQRAIADKDAYRTPRAEQQKANDGGSGSSVGCAPAGAAEFTSTFPRATTETPSPGQFNTQTKAAGGPAACAAVEFGEPGLHTHAPANGAARSRADSSDGASARDFSNASVHSESLLLSDEPAHLRAAVATLLLSEKQLRAKEYQLLMVARDKLLTPAERQFCKRTTALLISTSHPPSTLPAHAAEEAAAAAGSRTSNAVRHAIRGFDEERIPVTIDAPCRQVGDLYEDDD